MNIWCWIFVLAGLGMILGMAFYVRRYIRDVVDYLAAGRLAGRYVLSVAGLESALGLMALISYVEIRYRTGLALGFWNLVLVPLGIFLALTGFCIYRYRQTKSLSLGEFLEKRYNRSFRIFAMTLRTTAEMLTNTIGPAIAARVYIYLFDWPTKINLFGFQVDTFMLVMAVTLILALYIIFSGGMIALIVTDCLQGLMCYPIFVIFTIYILSYFSWGNEIIPTMANRVSGESFLDPFDIDKLRDFNIFALIVVIVRDIVNRGIWYGGGATSCARSAHEQKMAGVLGYFRQGFSSIMTLLFAIAVIVVLNHPNHAEKGLEIRQNLIQSVSADIISDPAQRKDISEAAKKVVPNTNLDYKFSDKNNPDTPYLDSVHQVLSPNGESAQGNARFQEFRSLYHQMMLPVTMRHILPPWLMAAFALLLIMLMISTDDSKMFSSSLTLSQDIILPLYGKPMDVKTQLKMIRFLSFLVALVFFFGSIFLSQLDYIQLYITIMTSIWAGGAGPVVLFGLYSRFGNTWGAYASLLFGSGTTLFGILVQRNWAGVVYPFLQKMDWVNGCGRIMETISSPFNPYIAWKMDAVKCPINSYEFFFFAMAAGMISYVIVSLLTSRGKRFDLDHLLYRDEQPAVPADAKPKISLIQRLVGISPEYTKCDKFIAWSTFLYSVVWLFGITFLAVAVWNVFSSWGTEAWSAYYLWRLLIIPAILGIITTVWFSIGGIRDMRQLFRDLAKRKADVTDTGFVNSKK